MTTDIVQQTIYNVFNEDYLLYHQRGTRHILWYVFVTKWFFFMITHIHSLGIIFYNTFARVYLNIGWTCRRRDEKTLFLAANRVSSYISLLPTHFFTSLRVIFFRRRPDGYNITPSPFPLIPPRTIRSEIARQGRLQLPHPPHRTYYTRTIYTLILIMSVQPVQPRTWPMNTKSRVGLQPYT